MRLSIVALGFYAGLVVLTFGVFRAAPTGFVPQQDMGRLIASIQLPDSASLERTRAVMAKVDKIVRETPGVAHTITICGLSFVQQANSPNFGSLFVILKPFSERQRPDLKDEAIMKKLRKRWAKEVKEATAVGSLYVNSFNDFGRHWQVTMQAEGQFRNGVEDLNLLQVRNNQGKMVPLGALVQLREISGPIFVLRYNLSTAAPHHEQLAAGDQLRRRDCGSRSHCRSNAAALDENRLDGAHVLADHRREYHAGRVRSGGNVRISGPGCPL